MTPKIYYRGGYKYQLQATYVCQSGIIPPAPIDDHEFITLSVDGTITIRAGYAWDGPSGPTFDTANFMRGSLEHDALYQLMGCGLLPIDFREAADRRLRTICREDGMSTIRAWWVYQGVRFGGGRAARTPEAPALISP